MYSLIRYKAGQMKRRMLKSTSDDQIELFLTPDAFKPTRYMVEGDYKIINPSPLQMIEVYKVMIETGLVNKYFEFNNLVEEATLCVPKGHLVACDKAEGQIVGTFMLRHNYDRKHVESAKLDWLAVRENHRGNHFGDILTSSLVNIAFKQNYRTVFVATNDDRMSAIYIYLRLGFLPNIYSRQMAVRWEKIFKKLTIEYKKECYLENMKRNNIKSFIKP
jgi:ribosomal protein S18 acetylase RimI-like enzyme